MQHLLVMCPLELPFEMFSIAVSEGLGHDALPFRPGVMHLKLAYVLGLKGLAVKKLAPDCLS